MYFTPQPPKGGLLTNDISLYISTVLIVTQCDNKVNIGFNIKLFATLFIKPLRPLRLNGFVFY